MLYLLFAIPISIADIATRKIPNIYLQLYSYVVVSLLVIHGLPDLRFALLVFITLWFLAFIGVGMGDCKLLALMVVMAHLSRFREFQLLLLAIFICALLELILIWLHSTVIPRTIAMAPAIFIGTSLYLATRQS